MKKILTIFTILTFALILTGCTIGEVTDPTEGSFTLTLESEYEEAVLESTPEGPYSYGDEVTISASWDEEVAQFVRWEVGGSETSDFDITEPTFDYTMEGDATFIAVFEELNTLDSLDLNANVDGVTFTVSEDGPYDVGETVTITPDYNVGTHTFIRWNLNGEQHSTTEVLEYTVSAGDTLEAVFELASIEAQVYEETFENFPESGSSYQSGSFVGEHDIEWTYTDSRGDKTIDGSHALTFGNVPDRDPSLSATLDEGIHSFSVEFYNPYSTPASLALYINGNLIEESGEVNNEIGLFEVENIDIKGTYTLELVPTNGQTTIDNMVWENYVEGSDYPEVTMESTFWDAEMHALPSKKLAPGSDVTVTASDPTDTYTFVEWQNSEGTTLSTESEYTFTLNEDTTVVSVFDNPERFDLDLETNLYSADMTKSEESPIIDGTVVSVGLTYPSGPHPFLGWFEGDTLVSDQESFGYTIDSDATLEARFDVPEDYDTKTMDELLAIDMYSEYDSIEDLYGTNLETALQSIVLQMTGVTYDAAGTILAESNADPDNPENVMLTYTRMSSAGECCSSWNREHVWPQSLLDVDTSGSDIHEGTDLHNLVPTNPGENSARGNEHYGVDGYMPPEEVRGDVARILFYMDVRYDGLSLVNGTPSTYEMGDLETLLQWHLADPVDDFEYNRNDVIEDYQGNRNPFIDYPHLAYLLYHDHAVVNYQTPTN